MKINIKVLAYCAAAFMVIFAVSFAIFVYTKSRSVSNSNKEVVLPTDDEYYAEMREQWQEFVTTNHALADTPVRAAFVNTLGEEKVRSMLSIYYSEDIYEEDASYIGYLVEYKDGTEEYYYVDGDTVVPY